MTDYLEDLSSNMVNGSYVRQGINSINHRHALFKSLLSERRLPERGWDDVTVEFVLNQISLMDSNNFEGNAGAGEREGRVYSSIVQRRHYHFSHGIGRSGDIAEVQPKAAGSSLLVVLTSSLSLHALRLSGLKSIRRCLVLPLATGMSMTLCLLALRKKSPLRRYVIWPRIDQKSCLKGMVTAGLTPLVVQPVVKGDELVTDVQEIGRLLALHGKEVLCVISTTSCFAPRIPDAVDQIASLCQSHDIAHLINNAYGLQCNHISRLIQRAMTIGRVDYVVQSTDKNFMVPVGGAVVGSPSDDLISELSGSYPGRASMSPVLDLCITLLGMGVSGLCGIWRERERLLPLLIDGLHRVAENHKQRLLLCPHNSISLALTLVFPPETASQSQIDVEIAVSRDVIGKAEGVEGACAPSEESSDVIETQTEGRITNEKDLPVSERREEVDLTEVVEKKSRERSVTFVGSMLFQRLVSGTRVVLGTGESKVAGVLFTGWGSHSSVCPAPYLTAACAVGMTEQDVDLLLARLDRVLYEFQKKRRQKWSREVERSTTEKGRDGEDEKEGGRRDILASDTGANNSYGLQPVYTDMKDTDSHITNLCNATAIDPSPPSSPLSAIWLSKYPAKKR